MNGRDLRIIECMAKAIHEVVCRKNPRSMRRWDDAPERVKQDFRDEARAAFNVATEMMAL